MDGPKNAFKNDGSFLEMFKQLQKSQPSPTDDKKPDTSSNSKAAVDPSTPVPVVAKRRGVRALPVGVVKKSKKEEESSEQKGEEKGTAWMQYMKEVRKYKERNCDEETKVRPLVK